MTDSLAGAKFTKFTREPWDLAGFRAKYGQWPKVIGAATAVEVTESSGPETAEIRIVGPDGSPVAGYGLKFVWPGGEIDVQTDGRGIATGPAPFGSSWYLPFGDGTVRPQLGPYSFRARDGSWEVAGIGAPAATNHDEPIVTVRVGGHQPSPEPEPEPEPDPDPGPQPGPAADLDLLLTRLRRAQDDVALAIEQVVDLKKVQAGR